MSKALLPVFVIALACLTPPAGAQVLLGDSSDDGVTLILTSEAHSDPGLLSEILVNAYLLALSPELKPLGILALDDYLPGAGYTGEFDIQVAARGGRFLVNLLRNSGEDRALLMGRFADGRFQDVEAIYEPATGDDRDVIQVTISVTGRHQAWFLREHPSGHTHGRQAGLDRGDGYELFVIHDGHLRTIKNVWPAAAFSADEKEVAYILKEEDPYENERYWAGRLVVEPVEGGELKTIAHGFFNFDRLRPNLVWSQDGGSFYVTGESASAEKEESLALFYEQYVRPRLLRVTLDGQGVRIFRNQVAMWMSPSPSSRWLYAFSYQSIVNGQARIFDANTGERLGAAPDSGTDEFEVMHPPWSGTSVRPLPLWLGEDSYLLTDRGGWLFRQRLGWPAEQLSPELQKLRRYLSEPSLLAEKKEETGTAPGAGQPPADGGRG